MGDVGIGTALPFPQRSGYTTRMREYPKLPPRLRWIFPHHPVFFVTFCTYHRKKVLATDPVHSAFEDSQQMHI
jgi:hypothetical protein